MDQRKHRAEETTEEYDNANISSSLNFQRLLKESVYFFETVKRALPIQHHELGLQKGVL